MRAGEVPPWWQRGSWERAGCPSDLGDMIPLEVEWTNDALRNSIEAAPAHERTREDLVALWLLGRRRFRLAASSMVSMVERLASYDAPRPFWMVRILCDKEVVENSAKLQEDGVCTVRVAFDVTGALKGSEVEFKAAVISMLEQAAKLIHHALEVDMRPLMAACEAARAVGYHNEWVWGEEVSSEGIRAQVRVVHGVRSLAIFMDLLDEEAQSMQSECLIEVEPWGGDVWHRYLDDIVWESTASVVLVDGEGGVHRVAVNGNVQHRVMRGGNDARLPMR